MTTNVDPSVPVTTFDVLILALMHVVKEHNVEPEIMAQFALAQRDLLEILQLHVVQTEIAEPEIADSTANVVAAMLLESHDTDDSLMTTSHQ